nr:minichromosome maintenance- protein [Polyrhizophydium stewartii]
MLDQRMLNRQVVSIKSVGAGLMREDVEQDWVMIGVIWSKSENKIAKNGSSFVMMRICDLAGNSINLFMFRESFEAHWKEKVGSVVAVLNPKIMAPLEKQTQVSIELDNPLKWMKIGDAVDLGTCQGIRRDKNPCQLPIDVTSGLHLGNPSVLAEERKRRVNVDGTFKVDGVTISTQGQDIKLIEPNRPDDPLTAQDEANLRKIAELAAGKSVGARYLRAAHKIPEPAAKVADQPLFSRTAIMLMGGNPLANDSTKQRSPSTTPKAARVHDFIAGKGDLTPS